MGDEFYLNDHRKILGIHGYVSSEENSEDETKDQFDEIYAANEPEPPWVDPQRHKIIEILPETFIKTEVSYSDALKTKPLEKKTKEISTNLECVQDNNLKTKRKKKKKKKCQTETLIQHENLISQFAKAEPNTSIKPVKYEELPDFFETNFSKLKEESINFGGTFAQNTLLNDIVNSIGIKENPESNLNEQDFNHESDLIWEGLPHTNGIFTQDDHFKNHLNCFGKVEEIRPKIEFEKPTKSQISSLSKELPITSECNDINFQNGSNIKAKRKRSRKKKKPEINETVNRETDHFQPEQIYDSPSTLFWGNFLGNFITNDHFHLNDLQLNNNSPLEFEKSQMSLIMENYQGCEDVYTNAECNCDLNQLLSFEKSIISECGITTSIGPHSFLVDNAQELHGTNFECNSNEPSSQNGNYVEPKRKRKKSKIKTVIENINNGPKSIVPKQKILTNPLKIASKKGDSQKQKKLQNGAAAIAQYSSGGATNTNELNSQNGNNVKSKQKKTKSKEVIQNINNAPKPMVPKQKILTNPLKIASKKGDSQKQKKLQNGAAAIAQYSSGGATNTNELNSQNGNNVKSKQKKTKSKEVIQNINNGSDYFQLEQVFNSQPTLIWENSFDSHENFIRSKQVFKGEAMFPQQKIVINNQFIQQAIVPLKISSQKNNDDSQKQKKLQIGEAVIAQYSSECKNGETKKWYFKWYYIVSLIITSYIMWNEINRSSTKTPKEFTPRFKPLRAYAGSIVRGWSITNYTNRWSIYRHPMTFLLKWLKK